jgi:D-sedoheptulose 7-phosphate isomerase
MTESFVDHLSDLQKHFLAFGEKEFFEILGFLESIYLSGNIVYLGGNGGSASIVNHFGTDWTKGINEATGRSLRAQVLNSNSSMVTALANDLGYQYSLSKPLEYFANANDAVLLVSSSGSSPNIIAAANQARAMGLPIIALSGFGKSELVILSDFALTFETYDYQIIEDLHSIFGHLVLKHFKTKFGH